MVSLWPVGNGNSIVIHKLKREEENWQPVRPYLSRLCMVLLFLHGWSIWWWWVVVSEWEWCCCLPLTGELPSLAQLVQTAASEEFSLPLFSLRFHQFGVKKVISVSVEERQLEGQGNSHSSSYWDFCQVRDFPILFCRRTSFRNCSWSFKSKICQDLSRVSWLR